MSDDAEWFDVDAEFGAATARPRRPPPPRATTARPWWVNTPSSPALSTTPGSWLPPTAITPHDAQDRAAPQPLQPGSNLAVILGTLGGVLGVLLLALVAYMFVLRKKLNKVQTTKRVDDYSIRVEDVAHLSTTLDDSTQLYVNTSDLHKLVNSVKVSRKNSHKVASSGGRPMCPIPKEEIAPIPGPSSRQVDVSNTETSGLNRFTGKINSFTSSLAQTLKLSKSYGTSKSNEGFASSIPDIIKVEQPEIDDDVWSEDSFDSFNVSYENESGTVMPRGESIRRSKRNSQVNDSKRKRKNPNVKSISPPSMPPPPPPSTGATDPIDVSVEPDKLTHSDNHFTVVRLAPQPPVGARKVLHHPSAEKETTHSPLPTTEKVATHSVIPKSLPALPMLPKPNKMSDYPKPGPPTAPKPSAKPQVLPKMNVSPDVPPKPSISTGAIPGNANIAPSKIRSEGKPKINAKPTNRGELLNVCQNIDQTKISTEIRSEEVDPSNLSVSARRALMEGKVNFSQDSNR